MRLFRLIGLLVVLAACGPNTDATVDDPQQEAAVRELIDRYYLDFNNRDWEAVADHFWRDAEITTVWREPGENSDRVVHTDIGEFFATAPRENPFGETFQTWTTRANVSVYQDLAQAWVWYGASLDNAGNVLEWEGVDAFTLLRQKNVWKIAALMFTSDDH